ncbi:MAG: TatD family hydrolase [bacterium]|nr:TatD family hydrolase [bacterium]
MFIDTHLHISDTDGINPDLYVNHALDHNVRLLIASFCEKEDIMLSIKFVEKYDCLYASVGYHPEVADNIVNKDYEILEKLVSSNSKIVAIGEIGLDYYWNKDNKEKQIEVFRKQLEIAEKLHFPVVIHSRDSIGETYEILSEYKVRGVIHCFTGSVEMAKKFIDLGFFLGIGGVLTFKNSKLYQVIEEIPLEAIVLETDSPYLAPEPHRGKVNESSNIPYIAQKIADTKRVSCRDVERITTLNATVLFDLSIEL